MISLKVEQQLNLLDLYADEICARIAQNLSVEGLGPLKEFLHKEQLELLLNTCTMAESELDQTNNEDEPEGWNLTILKH